MQVVQWFICVASHGQCSYNALHIGTFCMFQLLHSSVSMHLMIYESLDEFIEFYITIES